MGNVATPRTDDAFAHAHDIVLADRRIQFALPPAPRPHPSPWLEALARWLEAHWPFIRVAIWVVLGIAALAILWPVISRLAGLRLARRRPTPDAGAEPADWRPDPAPACALLAEADALAASGRYAEAARLLLARSIEDIARRQPDAVRPATTARDLAADRRVPAAARPAFAAIAGVVETALFAGRGATAGAWERARAAYADFALPGHWR